MKTVSLALVFVALTATSASALPPFWKEWSEKYVNGNPNKQFVVAATTAKCNVCHVPGAAKKAWNDYGKAIAKSLTKQGYDAVKANPVAAKAYVDGGLMKTEAEKSTDGKTTFGEIIGGGKLP